MSVLQGYGGHVEMAAYLPQQNRRFKDHGAHTALRRVGERSVEEHGTKGLEQPHASGASD